MKYDFWLEQKGTGHFGPDEQLIKEFLESRFPDTSNIIPVGKKEVKKKELTHGFIFASGSINFMREVLRKYEKELPLPYDYPWCVKGYLHRNIEQTTLSELKLEDLPKFIKPSRDLKRFTGFVCHDFDDFRLQGVKKDIPIHVSDVVEITDEARVFYYSDPLMQTKDIHCGTDDPGAVRVAREIVNQLEDFSYRVGSFDIGKINGRWGLVEVNDAFSIGAQGDVPPELYFRILFSRFQTLIK